MDIDTAWEQRQPQFQQLWLNQQIKPCGTAYLQQIWRQIGQLYSEPHRHYHTRTHILKCLGFFDKIRPKLVKADAVELALWYHDAIYEVGARDNEAKSAQLFQQHAEDFLANDLIDRVSRLILSTTHTSSPVDSDSAYLQDIDLSSFGDSWENFVADGDKLRHESADLSDEQYQKGKIAFFKMLIKRDRIYFTDYFYQAFEDIARTNIQRVMDQISASD